MEKWQEEINEVLKESEVSELTEVLLAWLKEVNLPGKDLQEDLDAVLEDVARDLPLPRAMRMAFTLGAAWQKAWDSRPDLQGRGQ